MKENVLISTIISINHSIFDQQISWFTSLSTAMEKHCKKQMQNGEETSWSRFTLPSFIRYRKLPFPSKPRRPFNKNCASTRVTSPQTEVNKLDIRVKTHVSQKQFSFLLPPLYAFKIELVKMYRRLTVLLF
jgi:hypothetical protein